MAAYPRIADDNLHVALEYSYLNQGPLDAAEFQPSCQLPYADCAAQAYRYSPMARSYSAPPSASMPSPSLMASRPRLHPDHPSSMVHQHFPGLQNLSGNTPTNTFSNAHFIVSNFNFSKISAGHSNPISCCPQALGTVVRIN